MIDKTVQEAAAMAGGVLAGAADPSVRIAGVSIDSRTVQPGNLFVPIPGERFDGHDFVLDSWRAGAKAVLWQADHGSPPEGLPAIVVKDTLAALQQLAAAYRRERSAQIIAVTGSNGKTTTKDMIAAVLSRSYKVHKTAGNYNNHLGLPLTLLQMPEDAEFAVLEMGMSGRGEIASLSNIARPDAAVITNIGEAHLMQLGSREAIAAAKLEILTGLREDGVLFYNGDEPLLERALQAIENGSYPEGLRMPAGLVRFGASPHNDVYPTAVLMDEDGTRFTVNGLPDEPMRIPLWGRHNVVNAAIAIAVARRFQVDWADIREGLANLKPTVMRAEIIRTPDGVTVLNETYNASPTAMRAALELLAELHGFRRKIAVIGDMLELGDQEEEFHSRIGRDIDPKDIDWVLTYGRLASFAGKEAGKRFPTGHVLMFQEKEAVVRELCRLASDGDVILVKGSRGMRMEDIVRGFLEARGVRQSG